MNTERIRELAKQAGDDWDHTLESDKEFLKKFAALVAAAEREACARVCEVQEETGGEWDIQQKCANAIRARGNE
jgi:hypothetical protein